MISALLIAALGLLGVYAFAVRPRLLRCGATDDEVTGWIMQTRQFAGLKRHAERAPHQPSTAAGPSLLTPT